MSHLLPHARTARDLGHAVRIARRARKLTQKQLSVMSGVRQGTVSNFERGVGDAKLDTLFALLAALSLELQITDRVRDADTRLEDIF
ncbi:MAG: helix-turn-helix transcriptional regulator [Pseudomonadota bacterium]